MAKHETNWILKLVDELTRPLRDATKVTKQTGDVVDRVTASLDKMDATSREAAKRSLKGFSDLTNEIKQEEKQIESLQQRLKDAGDAIDPLLKAQLDFKIGKAKTKVRRYKEQLVEINHELEEIESGPDNEKLKANWSKAVVVANQTVELVNKAVDGLRFTVDIEALRTSIQRMTGESGKVLDELTSKAYRLGKVFKENPDEIAKAANAMTKQIGGTYNQNLELIENGFKKGANINGDFLDQLKEFPTFIKQVGLSQSQAISLMAQAGQKGIWSDKAIDSIKEADLSLREMQQTQIDALQGIGLKASDIAGKTTFEAVQMISKSMEGATTQAKQLVLADIFKGAGEDAGLAWIEGLASIDLDINKIPSVEGAGSSIRGWLADIQTAFSKTFGAIGASVVGLAPVITGIAAMIPLMAQLKKVTWLNTYATKAWTWAVKILNLSILGTPIGWILAGIALLVGGIMWLSNNITGWSNLWKHTWEGAKLLFEAFILTTKANFMTLINGFMIGINKIREGWYNFKEAMGLGDSEENQKMLAQISEDTENRKNAIVDGYKKAGEKLKQSQVEFLLAGQSLKRKKDDKKEGAYNAVPGVSAPPKLDPSNQLTFGDTKGGGKGSGGKILTMNLEVNNYFNVKDGGDIMSRKQEIIDMVVGGVNDRMKDSLIIAGI